MLTYSFSSGKWYKLWDCNITTKRNQYYFGIYEASHFGFLNVERKSLSDESAVNLYLSRFIIKILFCCVFLLNSEDEVGDSKTIYACHHNNKRFKHSKFFALFHMKLLRNLINFDLFDIVILAYLYSETNRILITI